MMSYEYSAAPFTTAFPNDFATGRGMDFATFPSFRKKSSLFREAFSIDRKVSENTVSKVV